MNNQRVEPFKLFNTLDKDDRRGMGKFLLKGLFLLTYNLVYVDNSTVASEDYYNNILLNNLSLNTVINGEPHSDIPDDLLDIAFKQLISLFKNYHLLCKIIFDDSIYNYKYVNELVSLYYKIPQYLSNTKYQRKTPDWILSPSIPIEKFNLLADECNYGNRIFAGQVSGQKIIDCLKGVQTGPVQLASNSLFSFFMGKLAERDVISSQWQALVEKSHAFLSSKTGRPISRSSLSTLYNDCRDLDFGDYSDIRKGLNSI